MASKITYDLRNISIQPVARLLLLHPLKQTKIWHSNVGDLLNSSLNAFCAPHHHQHQDRRKKGWEMVLGSEVSFLIASWMQMINVWRQQPSPPLCWSYLHSKYHIVWFQQNFNWWVWMEHCKYLRQIRNSRQNCEWDARNLVMMLRWTLIVSCRIWP